MIAALLAAACTRPPPPERADHSAAVDHSAAPHSAGVAAHTGGSTGATAHTGGGLACDALPAGPAPSFERVGLVATEDLAFDAEGNVLGGDRSQLFLTDAAGVRTVLVPNLGEVGGIEELPDGSWALARRSDGYVEQLLPSGSRSVLVPGLQFSNHVEVDPAGYLYADDLFTGRVVRLTLATGELVELATVADASGMALSLDRRTLYVNSWFESDVYAVPLGPDGATGSPVRVVDLPAVHGLDDLALDACGNLYLAGYYSKQVLRADPATGEVVVLAEVTDPELMVSGLEWGRGVGGFGEEQLHVSNPWCCHFDRMLVLEVGVPGRPR